MTEKIATGITTTSATPPSSSNNWRCPLAAGGGITRSMGARVSVAIDTRLLGVVAVGVAETAAASSDPGTWLVDVTPDG